MSELDILAKQRAERDAKRAQKNTPAAQPQTTPTPSAPVVEPSSSSSSSSAPPAAPVVAAPVVESSSSSTPPAAAVVEVSKAPEAQASAPATQADSLEEQRRKRQEIINARLAQKATISVAPVAAPVATPAPASVPEKKPEEVVVVEKTEAVSSSSAPLSSSDVEVAEEEGLDPSQLSSSDEGDQEPQRTGGFKGKNFDPNYKQKKFQQQQQNQYQQQQQHHQGFQQFPQGYAFDPQGHGAPPPGFYPPHGYPYPPHFDPYLQFPPQYPEQDYSSSSSFDPSSSYPGASGPSASSNHYQYETYEEVSAYETEMHFQNFYGAEMMKTYREWVNGKVKIEGDLLPFLKEMFAEHVPEQAPEKPHDFESKKTKMISNSYARLAETSTQEEFEDNITIVLNTAQAEEQEKRADNWIPSCMGCSCCSGFIYKCDCVVSRNKKHCSLCRELLLASTDSETSSQPEQPDDVLEECVDLGAPESAPVLPMVMLDNTDEKAQEDTWFPEAMGCPHCNGFANRCPKRCFVSRLKNVSLIKPASPVEDA